MKLKKYNTKNLAPLRPTKPSISISYKKGLVSFSKDAIALLGLKEGTKLGFYQDEARPKDWYIGVGVDPEGFALRLDKGRTPAFNSAPLARLVLDSVGTTKSQRFRLAQEPTDEGLWAIITASAKL